MADYGVTDTGFKRPRLDDIKTDIEAELRAEIGTFINLLPSTLFGQFIGIFAERLSSLWDLAEAVYQSQYINGADGIPLQNVLASIGVQKLGATKSVQHNLYLYGTPGSIVPVNTQVRVPGNPGATFKTTSAVTLGVGQDQVQQFTLGAVPTGGYFTFRYINEDTFSIPYNATTDQIAASLNALSKLGGVTVSGSLASQSLSITFGGDSGKTPHPTLQISSNTMTAGTSPVSMAWVQNSTEGVPQGVVDAEALDVGPISAPLYTLTEIVNPVPGLTKVLNLTDASVGRLLEDDNAVRIRSKIAQSGKGRGTTDAIAARLKEVDGVLQALVFQNEDDVTDQYGLPPHSLRAYVQGGDDQDIRDMLWASKPTGIKTDGSTIGTVVASSGLIQPVKFSRPEVVPVFARVSISHDDSFPSNGADLVRDALESYINNLGIGDDVIVYPRMISALNGISGITDVTLRVGKAFPATSDDNLIMDVQQIARVINADTDISVVIQ
jgi:uncharacterized phage protein gp47/JayE